MSSIFQKVFYRRKISPPHKKMSSYNFNDQPKIAIIDIAFTEPGDLSAMPLPILGDELGEKEATCNTCVNVFGMWADNHFLEIQQDNEKTAKSLDCNEIHNVSVDHLTGFISSFYVENPNCKPKCETEIKTRADTYVRNNKDKWKQLCESPQINPFNLR